MKVRDIVPFLPLVLLYATGAQSQAQSVVSSLNPPVTSVNSALPDATGNVTMAIPTPGAVVPPAETIAGAVGSTPLVYALSTHTHPRITRATTVVTVTGGTFSGTWTTALGVAPNVILTPIFTGTGEVTCFLTAAPTTTTFAGRCTVDQSAVLSLSIVTAGLTIGPQSAAAGMSVQVLAIPPTQ